MARGRMITNHICSDKKVHGLSDDTCRLLFTWLITFADREGRVPGDAALVRSMVFPRSDIPLDRVESYLQELNENGLILLYEHAGDRFGWFPKFDKNQPGMRKDREPMSELPQPSDGDLDGYNRKFSGNLPDDNRQTDGRMEWNGKEGKGREEKALPPLPNPLPNQLPTVESKPTGEERKVVEEPLLPPRPEIFSIYESEIGPITGLIADKLSAAVVDYPEAWVVEALQEAALHNARSWAYCEAILKTRQAGKAKSKTSRYSQGTMTPPLTPEQEKRGQKPNLNPAQLAELNRAMAEKRKLLQGFENEPNK